MVAEYLERLHRGAAQVGGDVDTGAELIIAAACASGALRGAAVVFHLHHRGDGVAAVVVQLGILIQQLLGVLRQIEGGIAGDGLDPQRLADLTTVSKEEPPMPLCSALLMVDRGILTAKANCRTLLY